MSDSIVQKFDIKPGDLIEWTYKYNNKLVVENEILWSSIEKRYIPIGSKYVHMCIDLNDETYSWLNEKGLFRACVDDMPGHGYVDRRSAVVPRTRR